jgi:hypothetical protein
MMIARALWLQTVEFSKAEALTAVRKVEDSSQAILAKAFRGELLPVGPGQRKPDG